VGASTKSSPEPDLDALDESWDADEPESDDEPDEDVDSLEAGWGDPKRGRTAAEKARAREEKARLRAQRQKARAAAIAQKQKPKQKKRPSTPPRSAAPEAQRGEPVTEEEKLASPEPAAPRRAVTSLPRAPAKDWLKMGIAVAIIVALGLIVRFVLGKS
jgi:cell division protein FtsN